MKSKKVFKIIQSPRGFTIMSFKDTYEVPCILQESSAVTPSIWLGTVPRSYTRWLSDDKGQYKELPITEEMCIATRIHLSQKEVAALLPYLEYFAQTGHLPPHELEK